MNHLYKMLTTRQDPALPNVSKDQWAILAGLRFFLATTVVLGHFSLFVRLDPHHIVGDGYLNPGSAVFGFFILSGFSIASSVARETEGFYGRRFLRIWPLYLASIAFAVAVSVFLAPHGFTWPRGSGVPRASTFETIVSLLMLQTVLAYPIATVGPIWSLSAEWWHYMIAPLLKRLSNTLLALWIAASFVAFLTILPPPGHGIDFLQHGRVFVTTSWLWITGFLYYRWRGTPLGFLVLMLPSTFAATLGHFTGAPLFISIFVLVASTEIRVAKSLLRPLNFLGDYSYALYLFHIPAFIAALILGSNRSIVTLSAAFGISLIALYVVDYPSRRLLKRPVVASKLAAL
ncbi:acyltransferase [Paraburkholderia sp. Se-20369]|nr:acyltransferase [Paraburkholderia sp. Se-20369]